MSTTSTQALLLRVDSKFFNKHPSHSQFNLQWADYCNQRFSSVQFSHSVVSNSATPWTAARQAPLSITNSRSLLKRMPIQRLVLSYLRCDGPEASVAIQRALDHKNLDPWLGTQSPFLALPLTCFMFSGLSLCFNSSSIKWEQILCSFTDLV